MAVLVRPRSWGAVKPPIGSTINFGHPLAQGLVDCVLFNEGGGRPHELVINETLIPGATVPTWSPKGREYTGVGSETLTNPSGGRRSQLGAVTYMCSFFLTSLSITNALPGAFPASGAALNVEYYGLCAVANVQFGWANASTQIQLSSGSAPVVGLPQVMAGTRNPAGTAGALYLNGRQVASNSAQAVPTAGGHPIIFGTDNNSHPFNGAFFYYYMWNRQLSPSEIRALYDEPYAFINPPAPKILYYDLAGTPNINISNTSLIQLQQPAVAAGGTGTAATVTLANTPIVGNLIVGAIHSAVATQITFGDAIASTNHSEDATGVQAMLYFVKLVRPGDTATWSGTVASGAWSMIAAEYSCFPRRFGPNTSVGNPTLQTSGNPMTTTGLNWGQGASQVVIVIQAARAASTSFSSPALNSINATKQVDLNQASNASNMCLYDLKINTTDPNYPNVNWIGTVNASNAAVGMWTAFILNTFSGGLPNLSKMKPHPFSPGNTR